MLCTLGFYLLLIYVIYFIFFKKDPLPVCGVYAQPGKWFWLKYGLFRLIYYLRKKHNENRSPKNDGTTSAGYGMKSRSNVEQMEKLQMLLPEHPKAVDAVYFNASNKEGFYLVAATARRQNNVVQTVFMVHVPNLGTLYLPEFPDTTIINESNSKDGCYSAGNLKIRPIEPMKKWHVSYSGPVTLNDNERTVQINLQATWSACTKDYFDVDTDLNAHALASAIAREEWSRQYFENMKTSHQSHYEQFGDIVGVLKVEGESEYKLNLRGARDHSYGNCREWKNFHRYALQFVHVENGICFNVGVISQPQVTMSRLEFGYLFDAKGHKHAVEWCDLPLEHLGESPSVPPVTYEFRFFAGGQVYRVECEVLRRPAFYLGQEHEAKVYEQMCRYKVNGFKGYGFSEWEYRNIGGFRT